MEVDALPLACRIPVEDTHSQNDLIEDGWRGVEVFHILGRAIEQHLCELSPNVRFYEDRDRAGILKIIHDTKWTSRLFVDNTVPYHAALQHKYDTFEAGAENGAPIYVYEAGAEILGFVQMRDTAVELIASVEPKCGSRLLEMICWLAMSQQVPHITAGTSDDKKKIGFYYKNGFEIWESFVTFHKWKAGEKPSMPSCKPALARNGSRRKPSAKSPASR